MSDIPSWKNPELAAEVLANNWEQWPFLGLPNAVKPGTGWFGYTATGVGAKGPLAQSNESVILQQLEEAEDPSNWEHSDFSGAFGRGTHIWVRTRDDSGQITPSWRIFCNLQEQLARYPVLDEDDYSRREYEAQLEYLRPYCARPQNARKLWRTLFDMGIDGRDGDDVYYKEESIREAAKAVRIRVVDPYGVSQLA